MTHRQKLLAWIGARKVITTSDAARQLAMIGHRQHRERVRAVCDDMRASMGMPPVEWPKP